MRVGGLRKLLVFGLLAIGARSGLGQPVVEAVKLAAPTLARLSGDGINVELAWYGVKGAAGYQVLRAPDPTRPPTFVVTLPATTLGFSDVPGSAGPLYYRIVATGPKGESAASTWFPYEPPSVTSVVASGADVTVSWSGVKSAPGGYEIWRTINPQQSGTRVGAVSTTTLSYLDRQAGTGPFYYQVVAIGVGSWRAASAWFPFGAPPARAAAAACGCTQGRDNAELLKQIAALQAQIDSLKSVVTRGSDGVTHLTATGSRNDQTAGSEEQTIGSDRRLAIGGSDNVTIGKSGATTLGTDWQVTAGGAMVFTAANGVLVKTGSASLQLAPDGTITVSGSNLLIESAGDLLLQAGKQLKFTAPQVTTN
jgi:hypothetical protein